MEEGDESGLGDCGGATSMSWKVHLQGSHRKHVLEAGVMKCVVSRSLGEEETEDHSEPLILPGMPSS